MRGGCRASAASSRDDRPPAWRLPPHVGAVLRLPDASASCNCKRAHCVTNHPHAAAPPQSPIGARRRLGAELRRLRTTAGLTLDDVAERMTCSTSKISRLETGKGVPKVPDVQRAAADLRRDSDSRAGPAPAARPRRPRARLVGARYTEGVQPERHFLDAPGRYASLENDAIGGALLRPDDRARPAADRGLHARRPAASGWLHHSDDEIERLVALRLRRQQALLRPRNPVEFVDVLDESVLWRPVGGPA